jgi:hypothetical protein
LGHETEVRSGVNVRVTIFGDCDRFPAKKIGDFLQISMS